MPSADWRDSSRITISNDKPPRGSGEANCFPRFFLADTDVTVAHCLPPLEDLMSPMRLLLLPLSALLLTACGEPSEADLKLALEKELTQANQMTTLVLGDKGKIEVVAVHKLGCDQANGAYACTIEVETKLPVVGSQRQTQQVKVAEGKEGWVLVK